MGRLYYSADELLRRPVLPGMDDPTHLYYHFRPPCPSDLAVTRDPISGELNVAPGAYGVLSDNPLTICLHICKQSEDTARNASSLGTECVVALPARSQVRETWLAALPVPRGIFEGDIAGFTLLPSHTVSVPGIAECPVNLECSIESSRNWFSHWALVLQVVGASINTDLLEQDRQALVRQYPAYQADEQTNAFGGAIQRMGAGGDVLACLGFPAGARRGPGARTEEWLADLQVAHRVSAVEGDIMASWVRAWREAESRGDSRRMDRLHKPLTRALELAAWEEWAALRDHIVKNAELVYD